MATNIDAPFGLRAIRRQGGGKVTMHRYYNKGTTTAIFEGDIVVLQGANKSVLRLSTTTGDNDVIGVAANYVAAGTALQEVWVYDDPFTIFEVQSDGTTDTDHKDLIGSVAAAVTTAGNTTTGQSKVEIDYSSITSTGTASNNVFKIIGVNEGARNDSSSSHAKLEVLLFKHFMNYRSASV